MPGEVAVRSDQCGSAVAELVSAGQGVRSGRVVGHVVLADQRNDGQALCSQLFGGPVPGVAGWSGEHPSTGRRTHATSPDMRHHTGPVPLTCTLGYSAIRCTGQVPSS